MKTRNVAIFGAVILLSGCSASEIDRARIALQSVGTLIQINENEKQRQQTLARLEQDQKAEQHPIKKLCGGLHGSSASDNSACLPPPDLEVQPAPQGSVPLRQLRSCSNDDIAAQINEITTEGESLKQGAGVRRVNEVTAEVLGASIYIYEQAMQACDVDRAAYQNAVDQLRSRKAVAEANVRELS